MYGAPDDVAWSDKSSAICNAENAADKYPSKLLVLKARVEGRLGPTALPPPRNKRATAPSLLLSGMSMSMSVMG